MLLVGGLPINTIQGRYFQRILQTILNHPMLGVSFEHERAERVDPSNFIHGRADYLAADSGEFDSGVRYVPDENNPHQGALCPVRKRPIQEKGGIYYVAEFELVMAHDPGLVFQLDSTFPKLQDRFLIRGNTYYATAPAVPCYGGDTTVLYQVPVSLQRFQATPDYQ